MDNNLPTAYPSTSFSSNNFGHSSNKIKSIVIPVILLACGFFIGVILGANFLQKSNESTAQSLPKDGAIIDQSSVQPTNKPISTVTPKPIPLEARKEIELAQKKETSFAKCGEAPDIWTYLPEKLKKHVQFKNHGIAGQEEVIYEMDTESWSPDCRFLSFSIFIIGGSAPDIEKIDNQQKAEGLYIYNTKDNSIKTLVTHLPKNKSFRFIEWFQVSDASPYQAHYEINERYYVTL